MQLTISDMTYTGTHTIIDLLVLHNHHHYHEYFPHPLDWVGYLLERYHNAVVIC